MNFASFQSRLLAATAVLILPTAALAQTGQTDPMSPGPGGNAPEASTPAAAQPDMGGEIVVTATRQSEAISRVPLSISAYDQKRMDAQGVRTVDDVTRLTPGVTFNRSGRSSNVSIRGITSTVGAATTAIYIDDTPIQVRTVGNSATNSYPRVFDLERVEILRGPQGTLFGASSQGGAIRFITPKPSMSGQSIYARAEGSITEHGDPSYEAGIAFGTALIEDKIGLRASVWHRHDGGYIDRFTPPSSDASGFPAASIAPVTPVKVGNNVNDANAVAARLALGLQLGDAVTVTPSIFYQRETTPDPGQIFSTYSDPKNQVFRNAYVVDPYVKDRFLLPAMLVEVDLGGASIISNTSYYDRKFNTLSDYTYYDTAIYGARVTALTIPGQVATAAFTNTQKNWSQELRIQSNDNGGPLTWVVGGFYTKAKQYQFQDIRDSFLDQLINIRTGGVDNVLSVYGSELLQPNDLFFYTDIYTTDEQLAGFAQADYELFDGFKITAGVRISRTSFDTTVVRDGPLAGGLTVTNGAQSETPITPKVGVSWQVDPGNLFYATAAKGYRPGGAQAQLSTIACAADLAALGMTETPVTFNSDNLWSFEVGSKNRIGSFLSIDASAYIIKWKNIQQRVSFSSCGGLFVTNQGSATSKGIDLSVTLRPTQGLQLNAAVGYNKATFDQTISQGPRFLRFEGEELPIRPFTLTLGGEYQFPTSGTVEPYFRADYQYLKAAPDRDPAVFGYDPGLNASPLSAINSLRMRAGIRTGEMEFAVFADNVLNDSPVNWGRIAGRNSTILTSQAERPRTFGLFASYRY